jgi:hypothetical protein
MTIACKEDGVDSANVDIQFNFDVRDAEGQSLLDPATPNAYQASQLDIYYSIDGEKKRVQNNLMREPENFSIKPHEITNEYIMNLGPNIVNRPTTSVTYIQWNEQDTDTVTCEFAVSEQSIVTTRIIYNGQEVWSVDDTPDPKYPYERYFVVHKPSVNAD